MLVIAEHSDMFPIYSKYPKKQPIPRNRMVILQDGHDCQPLKIDLTQSPHQHPSLLRIPLPPQYPA